MAAASTGLTASNVLALVIDPSAPATIYAGTAGGVFKSSNRATSWSASSTGLPLGSVFTLFIDPPAPRTLYAGTASGVWRRWAKPSERYVASVSGWVSTCSEPQIASRREISSGAAVVICAVSRMARECQGLFRSAGDQHEGVAERCGSRSGTQCVERFQRPLNQRGQPSPGIRDRVELGL